MFISTGCGQQFARNDGPARHRANGHCDGHLQAKRNADPDTGDLNSSTSKRVCVAGVQQIDQAYMNPNVNDEEETVTRYVTPSSTASTNSQHESSALSSSTPPSALEQSPGEQPDRHAAVTIEDLRPLEPSTLPQVSPLAEISSTWCQVLRVAKEGDDYGNIPALAPHVGALVEIFDFVVTDKLSLGRIHMDTTIGLMPTNLLGKLSRNDPRPPVNSTPMEGGALLCAVTSQRPGLGTLMDLWEHWGCRWPYAWWKMASQQSDTPGLLAMHTAELSTQHDRLSKRQSLIRASGVSPPNKPSHSRHGTGASLRSSIMSIETLVSELSLFGRGSNKSIRWSLSVHSRSSHVTTGSRSTQSDCEMPAPGGVGVDDELRDHRGVKGISSSHMKRKALAALVDRDILPGRSGNRADLLAKMADIYGIKTDSSFVLLSMEHGPRVSLLPSFTQAGLHTGLSANDQISVVGFTAAVRKWMCELPGGNIILVPCNLCEPVMDPLALAIPLTKRGNPPEGFI